MQNNTQNYKIVRISASPEFRNTASKWFSEKWGLPVEAYAESMDAAINRREEIPEWYLIMDGDEIIAGAGIIDNDFHSRKDLMPNLCALYVEEDFRRNGIAGRLLNFVSMDMAMHGVYTLYLITEHDSFYERYGWEFMTVIKDDEGEDMRLYRHQLQPQDYIVL